MNPWDLPPRMQTVLQYLTDGLSSKQIADRMGVTPKTIEAYRSEAIERMYAKNSLHAAVMWDRHARKADQAIAGR